MKKIVASVGLVALGASSINAVHGQDTMAPPPYKPWSISASLRGFYDDNINTAPDKVSSLGFQVNPGAGLDWHNDQSGVKLNYLNTLRYYDKKPLDNTSHLDQDHQFDASLDHAFNERYQIGFKDSFVVGQEPEYLRSAYGPGGISEPQRISGSNIRNDGLINFSAQLTPLFGLAAGYENAFYDYSDHATSVDPNFPFTVIPSTAGLLNRIEHTFHLDTRWQLTPQTIGIVGYQFFQANYTGNELIANGWRQVDPTTFAVIPQNSDSRDKRAHLFYVGAEHTFSPDLSGSLQVGIQDTDNYNSYDSSSSVSPYATASLKYNYAVESTAEVGFSYSRNASDQLSPMVSNNRISLTQDEESAVVYANLHHRFTPHFYTSVLANFQNSTYNGGEFDGKSERIFLAGLDLQYRFNTFASVDLGYNYDRLESDVPGLHYDRNRVFLGLTAAY